MENKKFKVTFSYSIVCGQPELPERRRWKGTSQLAKYLLCKDEDLYSSQNLYKT